MFLESSRKIISPLAIFFILMLLLLPCAAASEKLPVTVSNFGLPGIVDLPTARRFPDGELVVTQQLHKSLARSGISLKHYLDWAYRFAIQDTASMVERRTVDLTMIGASTRIYRCWMRHTSPPYPSGFAILLARDGIRRNIS